MQIDTDFQYQMRYNTSVTTQYIKMLRYERIQKCYDTERIENRQKRRDRNRRWFRRTQTAFPGYGYDPGSRGDGDKAGSDGRSHGIAGARL